MLDALLIREFRNVDQAVDTLFYFHKRTELGQSCNFAFDYFSIRVTILDRVPWIPQDLPESETQPSAGRVHFQYDGLDALALLEHITGTQDSLGPGHLGNMNQTFHPGQNFDKSTKIRQPGYLAGDPVAWIELRDRFLPGIGRHLLQAE